MDRMRTRRPSAKFLPPDAVYEKFQPVIEWTEDSSSHNLLVYLPGFKREDIRVQLDNSGKLIVTGTKQVSDKKYANVNQLFDVPKDTIIEKIGGKFEDECLTLIMPKKVVEEKTEAAAVQKEKPKTEEKKDGEPVQQKPKTGEEKKVEEPMEKEKPKVAEEKKAKEPVQKEKPVEEPVQNEKPKIAEEKKAEEPIQKEKPQIAEEKKAEEPIQKEKPKTAEEEKAEEPIQEEKPKIREEMIQELTQQEKPKSDEKKKDEHMQMEKPKSDEKKVDSIQKEKPTSSEVKKEEYLLKKPEFGEIERRKEEQIQKERISRKRGSIWRCKEESWLDYGLIDGLLEKMNRNRKTIAVAVVAFSVGFYVSHKLRTSGK